MEKGGNIEAEDQFGKTPLLSASENGHDKIVQLLLGIKAKIEDHDEDGSTTLLSGFEKTLQLLLKLEQSFKPQQLFIERFGC